MRSPRSQLAVLLSVAALAACDARSLPASAPPGADQAVAARPAPTGASLTLQLGTAPGRRLQAVAATAKLRVTIKAADLTAPVTRDVELDAQGAGVAKDLPLGVRRIVTVRFLGADGKEVDGLHYRDVVDIRPGPNRAKLNDLSTAYGDIYAYMLEKFPEEAAATDLFNIHSVVDSTILSQNAASPRLLDAAAIATVMKDATGKNLPAPNPEWVAKPGYITVGFLDFAPNVPVRVSVNDAISAPAVSTRGEPVLVGPLAPRSDPYKITITPIVTGSTDLVVQTFDTTVSQDRPLSKFPSIFFSTATPGEPMPVRAGGGVGVAVGTTMWVVGGLVQPASDPPGIVDKPRVAAAGTAFTFSRAAKWKTANGLPGTFPQFGGAVAVDGAKVYTFGGILNGLGMDKVHTLDTTGGSTAQVASAPMTIDPARYPRSATVHLSLASAAKLGDKIYVAGGFTNIPNRPDLPFELFTELLEFDPATGAFEPRPPDGLGEELARAGMAGAVVGDNWVLAGGYQSAEEPLALVSRFDGAGWNPGAAMPTPRSYAAAVAHGGKLYVIGGEERKGLASRAVEVYDPVADTWTKRAPLKTPRAYPAAALVKDAAGKDKIVVAGGVYGIHPDELALPVPADKVEELTP